MIKKLLAVLCLCASAWATTSVTGNVKNLGTGSVSAGTFVRFYLRGCSGNQPRINGTGIIAPTLGNVYYFDFVPNSSGTISGTLYSTRDAAGTGNGEIECGGSFTSVWYGMVVFQNGKAGPETPVHAKNTGTIDISNVTPITTNPVITAPTGDSTYLRLDAGNGPVTAGLSGPFTVNGNETVTGALTAGSLDSRTIFVSQQAGADFCLKLQAALTLASNANTTIDARGFSSNQTCSVNPFANVSTDGSVTVLLPAVQITTSAQWFINNSNVIVKGMGWLSGGTLIANASTFPTGTPLVKLGDNVSKLIFESRLEDMYLSCNGVTNCQTFVGSGLNEGSGLRHVNSNNTPNNTSTPQMQVNFGTVTAGHFVFDDVSIGTTGANDGLLLTGTSSAMMGLINRLTCNNTGFTTGSACIHLNASGAGGATLEAHSIHSEGFTDTIEPDGFGSIVGSAFDCTGICTSIVHINSNKMQSLHGIWGNAGTNLVNNASIPGCSVTVAQESFLSSYRQTSTAAGQQVYIDGGAPGAGGTTPSICGASQPTFRIQSAVNSGGAEQVFLDMVNSDVTGWRLLAAMNGTNKPLQFVKMVAGTPTPVGLLDTNGLWSPTAYGSQANCSSSASPAVCAAAPAGSVAIANPATTIQVNTTAVTANSQIFVQEDSSLGTKLGVTCNTATTRTYYVSARTGATSFTITASATPAANSACLSYFIVN